MDESKRKIERKTDREERILFSIKKENENGKEGSKHCTRKKVELLKRWKAKVM